MSTRPTYKELECKVKELEIEREFFQEAISAVSHPFYAIDANCYKILMANAASIALYGDHSNQPFCYSWTHKRSTPCDGEEHPCPVKIIKKTRQSVTVEHTHYDKQGRPKFFEIHAYPLFDAKGNVVKIIEYCLEISKFKKMEEARRESEERYRSLLEASPDPIVVYDKEGRTTYANPAFTRTFGWSCDEVLGKRVDFVPQENWPETKDIIERMLQGEKIQSFETRRFTKDGKLLDIQLSTSLFKNQHGKPAGNIVIHRDVTERKQVQDKLRKAHDDLELRVEQRTAVLAEINEALKRENSDREAAEQELQKAKEASESANRAKSTFLANMSHELRTPLNAIIGYSEMLIEDTEDQGQQEIIPDLQKIREASKQLRSLINDVLDLSKIEAGKTELYLETFEVTDLIQDVVSTVQPLVEKNANNLIIHSADGLGTMYTDLIKVRQGLVNLLGNASKFTEHGTISLEAARQTVDGTAWITFSVSDTGIGMTPEQMEKLFQPFLQAEASMTRKYGGTGLGLEITRRFCKILGGDITAKSRPGEGSTFTIQLPAKVVRPKIEQITNS